MILFNFQRRYKRFQRYKAIANVLIKHGLGFVIEKIGLTSFGRIKNRFSKMMGADESLHRKATLAERLKSALEELGPSFIKFGQLLSLRPDMIPENFIVELSKLQDEVEPFPFEEAVKILENEYQKPTTAVFSRLDPVPIGSASISQVHRASLLNGEEVIVKIRRPGIDKTIDYDIEILFNIARMLSSRIPEINLYEPVRMVEEFAKHIYKELDFTNEAQSCERFATNFRDEEAIHIPNVHWEYSTPCVLVLEYIGGIKADHVSELTAAGFDLKKIAYEGARAFFKMILIDGLFHGDPHPGNVFIMPDGKIAFIDFGITGKLSEDSQARIINMFIGFMTKDPNKIVKNMLIMGVLPDNIDMSVLKYEIEEFIDENYGTPLKRLEIGKIMMQTIKIAVKHKIRVPAEYSLLSKATIEIESIGRMLDPDFEANKIAEPFLIEMTKKILWPKNIIRSAMELMEDLKEFASETPRTFNSIIKKIDKGKLAIEFQHIGLENLINKLDTITNRISVALIISAIVVASAFLTMSAKGPTIYGIPTLGFIGFMTAGVFGVALIISVFRSGKL